MEIESIEKVRRYAFQKFYDLLKGEYELPKFQSMDGIETKYISQDLDTREFVDRGVFGMLDVGENDLLELLDPIEQFCEKLQQAKTKFSDSDQKKELIKIIEIIEEKIKKLKESLDS